MADENIYFEMEPQDTDQNQTAAEKATQFDDIKSYSGKSKGKNKNRWQLSEQKEDPLTNYGNGVFKKLGGIIKAISFIVSFFIFVVMLVIALLLYMIDKFFLPVSIVLLIFGVVLAMIVMFLIYGQGQIISQNNEILRRLERKGYHR